MFFCWLLVGIQDWDGQVECEEQQQEWFGVDEFVWCVLQYVLGGFDVEGECEVKQVQCVLWLLLGDCQDGCVEYGIVGEQCNVVVVVGGQLDWCYEFGQDVQDC